MRMGLELGLTQELRLTPQLILTMKLLQVSALDLEQLVRKELEENPALESADGPGEAGASEVPDLREESPAATAEKEQPAEPADKEESATFETSPADDYTVKDLLPDDSFVPTRAAVRAGDDDVTAVDLAVGPGENLADAMLPRLRATLSAEDAAVAEFVLSSLDDNGFLTMSPEEIAENQGTELARLQDILHLIQRMEPGGIACRDRRESLLVQLELAGYGPDSLEYRLLADHWDLLMKKQTQRIARLCGVSEDDVREAIGTIVNFDTRPARRFSAQDPGYVTPDFSVEWQGDTLAGVPNDETFPRLRLSQKYVEMLRDPKSFPPEQVRFAREKFQRALAFLRGIESRRRTLKRLVDIIIDEQHDFFLQGPEHLKPATLRQAAGVLGVHPSTVSRAIAGKYVETTYGIFPFGYFFKAGASDKSRTSIKEQIRGIIEGEDKSQPLSDDEIGARLKAENIEISRRTVAKYRGELGISGCNERKQF